MFAMANRRVLYSVPEGVREAIEAEAKRLGTIPSRVASEFFAAKLPEFIAESVAATIRQSVADGINERRFYLTETAEDEQAAIDRRERMCRKGLSNGTSLEIEPTGQAA